jgi:hypothetical protein
MQAQLVALAQQINNVRQQMRRPSGRLRLPPGR